MMLGPYELGPGGENEGVYIGDARELAKAIPDESVDLIFTDPVYDHIEDYQWLAEEASRVLKPDRACLAWAGIPYLPDALRVMGEYLNYAWIMFWLRHSLRIHHGRAGITIVTPCLWFEKGKSRSWPRMADLYSTGNTKDSDGGHKWSKPLPLLMKWITSICPPGGIVWDPFCGSGSVPAACKAIGRMCLAFEIDEEIAAIGRDLTHKASWPLFVEQCEQIELPRGN